MARRVIRPNYRVTTALIGLPDQFSVQAASLGFATNTFSPMAAGVHRGTGSSARGPMGDPGFGVNRWAGRTVGPVQNFAGGIRPIAQPPSPRVGFGAGVSGQPGLPNTGDATGANSALGWMSLATLRRTGMGG